MKRYFPNDNEIKFLGNNRSGTPLVQGPVCREFVPHSISGLQVYNWCVTCGWTEAAHEAQAGPAVLNTQSQIDNLKSLLSSLHKRAEEVAAELEFIQLESELAGATRDDLLREIVRCHRRLEIDQTFVESGFNVVPKRLPYGDRLQQYDGIECREETIRLQDEALDRYATGQDNVLSKVNDILRKVTS